MAKIISWKQSLSSALFWSIIAAAFIGPGTVTTATKAGASFGTALVWALIFSTIATVVMQEAAARITLLSGKSLGEIIAQKYPRTFYPHILFLVILIGCAAYEAGNILGAQAGLLLIFRWPSWLFTLFITLTAGLLLWYGRIKALANMLGMMVAFMGFAFMLAGWSADINWFTFLKDMWVPQAPEGSLLLVIGLVGTTIVPYNLFLASGIGHGQSLAEMRIGVTMAVVIGGLISIGILLAGTLIVGEYSYEAFVQGLTPAFGVMAKWVVGLGLFAAGFTSAMTAPLAAAVTGQSLFGVQQNWKQQGQRYRLTWLIVLGTGFIFGITGIRPIPVIILAQALNGLLLPVVGTFLFKVINDRSLFSNDYNTTLMNILFLFILAIIIFIGLFNLGQAVGKLLPQIETILPAISAGLTLIWIGILILHHLLALRKNG